jgi:hypothetical protein
MRMRIAVAALIVAVAAGILLLLPGGEPSQSRAPASIPVIDAAWSSATADEMMARILHQQKFEYALPELRVYDSHGRLIYRKSGAEPGKTAEALDRAIKNDKQVAGPAFAETVSELELRGRDAARLRINPGPGITLFDYWAEWCVPCKILEKELLSWAADRPSGSVRIVKAEADLPKIMRAHGIEVTMKKEEQPRSGQTRPKS